MIRTIERLVNAGSAPAFIAQVVDAVRYRYPIDLVLYDFDGRVIWKHDDGAPGPAAPDSNTEKEALVKMLDLVRKGGQTTTESESGMLVAPVSLDEGPVAALAAIPQLGGIPAHDRASLKGFVDACAAALSEWMSARANVSKFTEQLAETYEEISLVYTLSDALDISKGREKSINVICETVLEVLRGDLVVLEVPAWDYARVFPEEHPGNRSWRALADVLTARADGNALAVNHLRDDRELTPLSGDFSHAAIVSMNIDGDAGFLSLFRCKTDDRFFTGDIRLLETVGRHASISLTNQKVMASRRQLFDASIFGLARLAESRDQDTGEHLERVREHCRLIADFIRTKGGPEAVTEEFVEEIYRSSPLHDIGKVGIPDAILLKPGKLTPEEFEVMKAHSTIGGETLRDIERRLPSAGDTFLTLGRQIAFSHHEKWDGSGYPRGLAAYDIPLAARIVALADVYDALTSKRCYKAAMSPDEARSIIVKGSGHHFDPAVIDAFLHVEFELMAISERLEHSRAHDTHTP